MSKKPTHKVVLKRKSDGAYNTIGAAWQSKEGWFNITLNDSVVLDWRMKETHYINIYPRDTKHGKES